MTTPLHDAEQHARGLVAVLREWCPECAPDVARRMVVLLEPAPTEAATVEAVAAELGAPSTNISSTHAAMILRGCFAASKIHGVAFEGGAVDTFAERWWDLPAELQAHWQSVGLLATRAFKGRL